jgi:prophage maintenance system killer protein
MDVLANQIQIYTTHTGQTQIEVQFDGDTVWLSQAQLIDLFESSKANISEHIKRIFLSCECSAESTVRKFRTVRFEGKRQVLREIEYYNLDVIISIGYRVNSKRGIEFRQWASQRLKDYLVEGFAINEMRLEQKNKELQVLHDGVRILSRALEEQTNKDQNYFWLNQFSVGLQLLDDYDHACLDHQGRHFKKAIYPSRWEYEKLVRMMCLEFNSAIFGKEKDGGFDSSINQIKRGFGEQDVYPSIEEKAAMLLYLVVKNHSFVDGNKRIAAACFILFLERNVLLYNFKNETIISNEALASLTLFVAASKAEEMQTVKNLLISVLNRGLDR